MPYYRKIIKVRGEDSPNVRLAMAQVRAGIAPTEQLLIPGILPWDEYCKRRRLWDKVRQCIGLDAEFWEGADVLLYPPEWLNCSERRANLLKGARRCAKGIGIDPAEGGDKTTMAVSDERGLIELVGKKTPDTNVIVAEAKAFAIRHNVPPEKICFDRGGGGKGHADRMRADGWAVRTVAFGESMVPKIRAGGGIVPRREKVELREERYVYKNRRAQLYGRLRILLDPARRDEGLQVFALPAEYTELRRQMALIPLTYDTEGRLYILPKRRRPGVDLTNNTRSLEDLLGCSPDETDAVVLSIYAMETDESGPVAGPVS